MSLTVTLTTVDYLAAVEQLGLILERHGSEKDILSNRIREWGMGVFASVLAVGEADEGTIAQIAAAHIDRLAREILVDPLTNAPLREPVLEREWIWEAAFHWECQELFENVSPLDGKPMNRQPPLHQFAKEMIDWLNRLSSAQTGGGASAGKGKMVVSALPRSERRRLFERLAQAAVVSRQCKMMQEAMSRAEAQVTDFMSVATRRDRRSLGEAARRAEEHEGELQAQLESMKEERERYKQNLADLEARIEAQGEVHRRDLAELEKRMGEVAQANETEREAIKQQRFKLAEEHRHTTEALERQVGVLQSTLQTLNLRVAEGREQHLRMMAANEATRQHTETQLRRGVEVDRLTIERMGVQLAGAQHDLCSAKEQVRELKETTYRQEDEVRELRRTIASSSGCIIS